MFAYRLTFEEPIDGKRYIIVLANDINSAIYTGLDWGKNKGCAQVVVRDAVVLHEIDDYHDEVF